MFHKLQILSALFLLALIGCKKQPEIKLSAPVHNLPEVKQAPIVPTINEPQWSIPVKDKIFHKEVPPLPVAIFPEITAPEIIINETIIVPAKVFSVQEQKTNILSLINNLVDVYSAKPEHKNLILLDFTATWCIPCGQLTPDLIRLQKQHKNLEVLSLFYEGKNGETERLRIMNYAKAKGINYGQYFGDKDIADFFGIQAYPTLVLLSNGNVIWQHVGRPNGQKMNELEKLIKGN